MADKVEPGNGVRFPVALAIIATLSGCAGFGYALEHYSDVPVIQHQFSERTWRVLDKPQEQRLMITPSLGDAAAAGAIEGMTLGLSGDMSGPQGAFRMAAADFLAQQHPRCTITDGALVVNPQYEFFYSCK